MPSVSSADMPVHFGLHLEKENDHPLRKSGKQHHHSDEAGMNFREVTLEHFTQSA